jgi:transposase InsO family protein
MCNWLNVSRSGYYDWCKRSISNRSKNNARLDQEITAIHLQSRGTYGSPRVHRTLKTKGYFVGKKRVERLMREHGLRGRVVRVTRRQPGLKRFKASGNYLWQKIEATKGINQVWVADITYLKVKGKWSFLSTVMDVHSRRILGWSLGRDRTTKLTLTSLGNALKNRPIKNDLIFHTDRGIEYTAFRFQDELKKNGIRHSVNRPGCCTDNAHMESFYHTLKAELIRGTVFDNEDELRYSLNSYINQFYNHKRMHSGIGYVSPAVYEKTAA